MTTIDPSRVLVVAVGIDCYQDPEMRLNGAAAYAHRFAEWALGWGVPADNVWLACSWPSDTAIPSSPARQLQPTFTGIQDLLADAAEFDADLLLLYWCGHGVLNIQRERTLFTADARAGVRRQHNVSDIQQYLSSTTVRRLDRQIIVVDACANFYADLNLDEALPGGTLNTGRPRHVNHYQLFSASQGQIAEHDPVTGTTLFSELVLEWLAAADPTALPDVNELTAHVSAEFARSDLRQRPTTFVLRHSHGENRDWSYAGGVLGGAAPQIVVGAIPAAPAALVVRPAADALARQVREAPVVAVVTGLRGVGKSQLAAELARSRVADGCGLVLWLNAEESDGLLADLAAAADALGVADPEGDSTKSARRLRDTLSARREPGLLVFDNATDPDRLRAFLPVAGPVRVVITSTDQTFAELGKRLPLDVFHRDESVDYLARVTGLEDPSGADALAIELGDLPLALAVAAAAIAGPSWGWGGYRDYLAELRAYPLDETLRRRVGSDYPRSVVQAVLLSRSKCIAGTADPALDRDTESDQLTGRVLETLAMLSPDGVPPDFLTPLAGQQPAKRQLRRAIERCVTASLVSWSGDRELLLMHRLVGRVLREQAVADDSVGRVAGAALELLTDRLFDHREAWQRRAEGEQLLAQIEAIWATGVYTDPDPTADASVAAVLDARSWAVRHLMERADLARAIPLGEVVLSDRVRVLGADHPSTLTSRHNLAGAYESAGRVGEAIDLFEVVLSDSVRVLGADHPSTLVSRHNLAGAYRSAGRVGEAIDLFEAVLSDRVRVLGADHPSTLVSRHNLAGAYESAGRVGEAIDLFEAVLSDSVRVLGADHPDTLTSRHNLAGAYESAGRVGEAIDLFEAVLSDRVRVLGADHPNTLASRHNLAYTYRSAGRLGEAIDLFEAVLSDRVRVLGADHPNTLASRHNLAYTYRSAGRLGEAIDLFEAVLTDSVRVLGADHPNTLASRNNLADAYESAGRVGEAIDLFEAVLTDRVRVLGADHPNTLTSRHNLADAYESVGRVGEAIELFEAVLTDTVRVLGADHPDTLATRQALDRARAEADG